jgi:hypothetical protein
MAPGPIPITLEMFDTASTMLPITTIHGLLGEIAARDLFPKSTVPTYTNDLFGIQDYPTTPVLNLFHPSVAVDLLKGYSRAVQQFNSQIDTTVPKCYSLSVSGDWYVPKSWGYGPPPGRIPYPVTYGFYGGTGTLIVPVHAAQAIISKPMSYPDGNGGVIVGTSDYFVPSTDFPSGQSLLVYGSQGHFHPTKFWQIRNAAINSMQLVDCYAQSKGDLIPVTIIPDPIHPMLPVDLPVPNAPLPSPCPILTGGVITTAPPGTAGKVNIVPGINGELTVNIAMPDCTCKDGVTPTFAIGKVTHDNSKPISVTMIGSGVNSYILNFNMPSNVPDFVPLTLTLPYLDPQSGTEIQGPVTVYCPSDGVRDMSGAIGWILEQILELRAGTKAPPPTQTPMYMVSE